MGKLRTPPEPMEHEPSEDWEWKRYEELTEEGRHSNPFWGGKNRAVIFHQGKPREITFLEDTEGDGKCWEMQYSSPHHDKIRTVKVNPKDRACVSKTPDIHYPRDAPIIKECNRTSPQWGKLKPVIRKFWTAAGHPDSEYGMHYRKYYSSMIVLIKNSALITSQISKEYAQGAVDGAYEGDKKSDSPSYIKGYEDFEPDGCCSTYKHDDCDESGFYWMLAQFVESGCTDYSEEIIGA